MPSLQDILSTTRRGLKDLRARRAVLERAVGQSARTRPSFRSALQTPAVAVIAEVKRRSPSAGSIREDLDPGARASLYAANGAAAISVLTDAAFFGGSMEDLSEAVTGCSVPVLRKDFILDEVQILEACAAGASAVLLIVRVLDPIRLESLLQYSTDLGLDALVEVHTGTELAAALNAGATIIGVNSRDLDTFQIDTGAAWDLVSEVPPDRLAVAESVIATEHHVVQAAAAGADAVLVGTALSAAPAPEELLRELTGVPRHAR